MKKNQGITLIALVITIIVLLILAGITINLTIGSNGIISMSKKAKEEHEIGEILDRLELEKVDLVAKKGGEIPTVQEYADHVTQKGGIDDAEQIDENNSYVTVGNYMFLVEKEADGNIKITYQGKVNNDSNEPIQVRIIKLNKETIDLEKGEEETLTATIFPKTATNKEIVWSSSNEEIATVDNQGKVTAVKGGEADIIATAADGSGVSASCKIAIPVPPPSVEVSTSSHTAKQITYTWPELVQLAKLISDKSDVITSNTEEVAASINGKNDKLGVGDTIKLDGKTVRLLGFNHDPLANQASYGGTNTYAGISFVYEDVLGYDFIISSDGGNWGNCNMRNNRLPSILNNLSIKDSIREVKKEYIATFNNPNSKTTSNDKLWLLSCGEICNNGYNGGITRGRAVATEGKQYKYYKKVIGNTNYEENMTILMRKGVSWEHMWGLRSPERSSSSWFCMVEYMGNVGSQNAVAYSVAIFPGFCI